MEYHAFTGDLVERATADPRITGLVAVGSMAAVDYDPDRWSDHDFFVIVPAGRQEDLRNDLSWLPRGDEIELAFRETAHGLKVVYEDGHLAEFAVFDLEELGVAGINRYRVLLDRGGVEERVREVAARRPQRQPDDYLFGMFVTGVQVGAGRIARGERLSGASFLVSAARHLCTLLAATLPAERRSLLDDLDALRRFELVYPELGAEIEAALRDPAALLLIAERELRPVRPELPWQALGAVRARVQRP